jgi:HAE1 family hydrophobic/amphiphilic exporter-1
MAQAVIGGLITSTILTLFVVPIVYTILDGLKKRFAKKIHRKKSTPIDSESNVSI